MSASTMSPLDERLRLDVAAQLERILADELFAASERHARFLRYVVEQTLAGRAAEIKELVIAMEVYGRTATYDPKRDSSVRVEASRLRDRLRRYYEQHGADPVVIAIPLGTYVPHFVRRTAFVATPRRRLTTGVKQGVWGAVLLAITVVAWQAAPRAVPAEAVAAWREGNALLQLDPHSSRAGAGIPRTLARAIERYEAAVAASPGFAPGWASLAEAYEYASAFVGRDAAADADRAEHAAQRAVRLDPNLPEAHAMLALVRFYLRWDFAGAEVSYRRALALDPRAAWATVEFADLLSETNRLDEALALIRRARALQPALPVLGVKEAELLVIRGRGDEAIASATAALDLKRDSPRALVALGAAFEANGDAERAAAHYQQALDLDPRDRRALPALGYLSGVLGRDADARALLTRLDALNRQVRNCAFQMAVVHAGLGEHERALDWLERAYGSKQMHTPFMAVEPRFRRLRGAPRFDALVRRLGLRVVTG